MSPARSEAIRGAAAVVLEMEARLEGLLPEEMLGRRRDPMVFHDEYERTVGKGTESISQKEIP